MKMYNRCEECGARYTLKTKNTVVYLYLMQPWMSWLQMRCNCGAEERLFIRNEWQETIRSAKEQDFGFITEAFAPKDIVEAFETVYDLHPITERHISQREERHVEFFHWLMETQNFYKELGLE